MKRDFLVGGLVLALVFLAFMPALASVTLPSDSANAPLVQATTAQPTGGASSQSASGSGISASDAEKIINGKFGKADTTLALWAIQPGLGTVMIEYGNRLARLYFAGQAGNWDMAKYQLDEMREIQEVGEITRPNRAPMLKAFESNYLDAVDKAIAAKDKAAFGNAMADATAGCNGCHKASSGATWKSYQYVAVQFPKTDPAFYIDWKGAGQGNYIPSPTNPAPSATAKATLSGTLDAAGVEKLINTKFNTVDTTLALWAIQPGLGTVMIEYGNRFSRLYFAAKAGNWDMAKYQVDEMREIQEVGEITRPGRAPMLKAFESNFLDALDKAVQGKDSNAFNTAYNQAVAGCNGCHAASSGANWKSYNYVKIQVPNADNSDYVIWNASKGTGNYVANPPASPSTTPRPALTGSLDAAGVEKLVNSKFNTVDTTLALWGIQPGLGTVMIEYGRRFAQLKTAVDAGNWDMAKYQLDEMIEIQEVGETTRPGRAPMLKAFESNFLNPLDSAIMAKDKAKSTAAFGDALNGCNGCHAASKGTNWASYAYIQIQAPKTDPADYIQWSNPLGTGNYVAPAAGTPATGGATLAAPGQPAVIPTAAGTAQATVAATARPTGGATAQATAPAAAGAPPNLPANHAGRTMCLVCHATGVGGAPKIPSANPDHTAFTDANNAAMCLACHVPTK